jgi:WD40 repeat protein
LEYLMNQPNRPGLFANLRKCADFADSLRVLVGLILMLLLLSACSSSPAQDSMDPTATIARVSPTEPETLPTETEIPTAVPTSVPSPTPTPLAISADNLSDLEILLQLHGHSDRVTDVAVSADNTIIASSSADGTVRVWDIAEGAELYVLQGHKGIVNSVAFSPDGSILASGGDDRIVRIWDMKTGEEIQEIKSGLIGRVLRVEYSPDGNLLAVAGHYCYIELRQARSGILRRTLAQPGCVSRWDGSVAFWGIDFSPDGTYIATGDSQAQSDLGSIYHWVVDQYVPPDIVKGNRFLVRDLSYSPKGENLAVALLGGYEFWLIDIESRDILQKYSGHSLRVNSVDFNPNGDLIGSASRDRSLRLWDPAAGESLRVLLGHEDAVNSLVFSTDGSLIVSGSDDRTVILWGLPE